MDESTESSLTSFLKSIQRYSWAYLNLVGQDQVRSWTPTLTFVTPGNLSVTYSQRVGRAVKMGNLVLAFFRVVTSAFTHTTASGSLTVSGLPYTCVNFTNSTGEGGVRWGGITKANYTHVSPLVAENSSNVTFTASGSAQAISLVVAADMPSGGTVQLSGFVVYLAK